MPTHGTCGIGKQAPSNTGMGTPARGRKGGSLKFDGHHFKQNISPSNMKKKKSYAFTEKELGSTTA